MTALHPATDLPESCGQGWGGASARSRAIVVRWLNRADSGRSGDLDRAAGVAPTADLHQRARI